MCVNSMCGYTCACVFVGVSVFGGVCLNVCEYRVFMCACVYVCACVSVCVHASVCVCQCVRAHPCVCTRVCMCVCTRVCMCMYMHLHVSMHVCACVCACECVCMHMCVAMFHTHRFPLRSPGSLFAGICPSTALGSEEEKKLS
jgi:hypothetical protein